MEDDTSTAEERAVGGAKEEQPVGDTAARSAVNVAATARADLFVIVMSGAVKEDRMSS